MSANLLARASARARAQRLGGRRRRFGSPAAGAAAERARLVAGSAPSPSAPSALPAPLAMAPSTAPTATVSPALTTISPSTPGSGRRHLDRHLVGLELDQRLVGGDRIARLLEPFADGRLGHGFAQRRHADLGRHASSSPQSLDVQRLVDQTSSAPAVLAHQVLSPSPPTPGARHSAAAGAWPRCAPAPTRGWAR